MCVSIAEPSQRPVLAHPKCFALKRPRVKEIGPSAAEGGVYELGPLLRTCQGKAPPAVHHMRPHDGRPKLRDFTIFRIDGMIGRLPSNAACKP